MKIEIHPLEEQKFDSYFEQLCEDYATQLCRSDRLSLEKAKEKVAQKNDALLPKGRLTPQHYFFALFRGPQDVGRAWLHVNSDESTSWLYDIQIFPAYRRQGLGKHAMTSLFQKAKELGGRVFWLNVFEDNEAAKKLYHSLGLRTVAHHMNVELR